MPKKAEKEFEWNDIQRVITSGIVGGPKTWPSNIYQALNEKGYINFTDACPDEVKATELIYNAINDFHEASVRGKNDGLIMTIYTALLKAFVLKTSNNP